MQQYPMFTRLSSDARKGTATCGGRDRITQSVMVGTSSSNSHEFATIEIERIEQHDGRVEFALYVDGVMIKRGLLDGKRFDVDIDSQRSDESDAYFSGRELANGVRPRTA